MQTNIVIVGFGVIGTEFLSKFIEQVSKSKKIRIFIIDKNFNNIPGGEAYSIYQSKYGFFNNPLRISNPEFITWIKKKENISKLCDISKLKKFSLKEWLSSNSLFCKKKTSKFNEIYFPRFFYSYFLEEKIIKSLKKKNKKKISVFFLNSNLESIELNKKKICHLTKNTTILREKIIKNKIFFKKTNQQIKKIETDYLVIGTGIIPPKKISSKKLIINQNYVEDFYGSRGTYNLIRLIKKNLLKKNKLKIVFIGNKAGLLEALPELENFIMKDKKNIKLDCVSSNSMTLEKATLSKNFKMLKLEIFEKQIRKKKLSAKDIFIYVKKEIQNGLRKKFSKYDVWTLILKKKVLDRLYNLLSQKEKNIYNQFIFPQIRNITRYTFPRTIESKERLQKEKVLFFINDRILTINEKNKKLSLSGIKNNKIKADIVVNVSGPASLENINHNLNYIESLKNISKNYNNRGFLTNSNFHLKENIFLPGTLSLNFNPKRLTIIKAITKNAHKVGVSMANKIN